MFGCVFMYMCVRLYDFSGTFRLSSKFFYRNLCIYVKVPRFEALTLPIFLRLLRARFLMLVVALISWIGSYFQLLIELVSHIRDWYLSILAGTYVSSFTSTYNHLFKSSCKKVMCGLCISWHLIIFLILQFACHI